MGSVEDEIDGPTSLVTNYKELVHDDSVILTLSLTCSIHETLTKLQQEQLEKLRHWLTATEDRISQLAAVPLPETFATATQMLHDHHSLQQDLEDQQGHVNALSNMVVIVDESAGDSKHSFLGCLYHVTMINICHTSHTNEDCAQMEDQLSALGERWSHVCKWAEQRASALQQLTNHWEQLDTDFNRLKSWLAAHEQSLRLIETNPNADRTQMIDVARQLQVDDDLLSTPCPVHKI